jgi:hypothetical protein
VVSVVEALERELGLMGERASGSALAASALVLARQLDDPGVSATSKSMCARALRELLDRLRELAPEEDAGDRLDEIAARRASRRAG